MIEIKNLDFSYSDQTMAIQGLSLSVSDRAMFGLLGPNGSGKTTLFRILATLLLPERGVIDIAGFNLFSEYRKIRQITGIVFQSPSLDAKLTVRENLMHQGHLYGLFGEALRSRVDAMLKRLGIEDRKNSLVGVLSGGLKRRVELAKGLLHRPRLLLLDEPSTGLDPAARMDLWNYLKHLQEEEAITIVTTTHLMEEAEHCGNLAIMNKGRVVALGTPNGLKAELGGDVLVILSSELEFLARKIRDKFHLETRLVANALQIEHQHGPKLATQIIEAFPGKIESLTFRKPTLEDVFVQKTGYKFWGTQV